MSGPFCLMVSVLGIRSACLPVSACASAAGAAAVASTEAIASAVATAAEAIAAAVTAAEAASSGVVGAAAESARLRAARKMLQNMKTKTRMGMKNGHDGTASGSVRAIRRRVLDR